MNGTSMDKSSLSRRDAPAGSLGGQMDVKFWPNCEILTAESPQMLKSQIFTVFFAWPVCYQSETCSPGKGKWLGPGVRVVVLRFASWYWLSEIALMANRFNRLHVVCALTLHRSVVPLPV